MKTLSILLIGIVIGFGVAFIFRKKKRVTQLMKDQQGRKEENLEKLLKYLEKNPRVTNDKAEELLGISHATAFRYLEELEKKGILRQVGNTGSGVYYEKL